MPCFPPLWGPSEPCSCWGCIGDAGAKYPRGFIDAVQSVVRTEDPMHTLQSQLELARCDPN